MLVFLKTGGHAILGKTAKCSRVYVMMATYNGEKYIEEQIESIFSQESVEVFLRVCDDGSTDNTCEILKTLAQKYTNMQVSYNEKHLDVGKNFMQMVYDVNACQYDYYAFADQDDVWLPNKLQKAITKIHEHALELSDRNAGVLYYSDYTNVDENLNNPQREKYVYKKSIQKRMSLLLKNWAPGCTMVFNQALCEKLQEYIPPAFPRIHDSWVHLVAYYCAHVVADLDNSYILRRISDKNVVGREHRTFESVEEAKQSISRLRRKSLRPSSQTAQYLLDGYTSDLSETDRRRVVCMATYADNFFKRLKLAVSRDFKFPGIQMSLIIRVKILLGRF